MQGVALCDIHILLKPRPTAPTLASSRPCPFQDVSHIQTPHPLHLITLDIVTKLTPTPTSTTLRKQTPPSPPPHPRPHPPPSPLAPLGLPRGAVPGAPICEGPRVGRVYVRGVGVRARASNHGQQLPERRATTAAPGLPAPPTLAAPPVAPGHQPHTPLPWPPYLNTATSKRPRAALPRANSARGLDSSTPPTCASAASWFPDPHSSFPPPPRLHPLLPAPACGGRRFRPLRSAAS